MRLLCCVDFGPSSDRIVAEAVSLARPAAGEVVLLHVAPAEEPLTSGGVAPPRTHPIPPLDMAERTARLEAAVSSVQGQGVDVRGVLSVDESPAEAVLREAESQGATHIVLGSHGHAMVFELLVGSFTQAVLRHSRLPVVVIPVAHSEE
ncbi:MAG: universal stress protein [Sandaracinaceae bacterium]|nr:universal stress protein [Sandaracinaceae bacterium]